MKKKSKLMAAVFAFILGVSTVMPGMQAQAANMDNFPVQNMSTHQKNYTAGLQTFLLNYHKNTKDIIKSHGMVDGSYGKGTADAVSVYQELRHLSVDGSCGHATWKNIHNAIQHCSSTSSGGYQMYRLWTPYYNSGKCLRKRLSDNIWNAWYGNPSDTDGSTVMWHYVG